MFYLYLYIFLSRHGNTSTIEDPFYGADVVQRSMVLDKRLSDLCCSVSMM